MAKAAAAKKTSALGKAKAALASAHATATNLALRKLKKKKGVPEKLEVAVAQAIFDLEIASKELKPELQPLHFVAAKEVIIKRDRKAIVIFVPKRQIAAWHRIYVRLVRELEKKFSGKQILIIAQRRWQKTPSSIKVHRPIARTRAVVEQSILEDVVYPVDIVGKRTRVKLDGSFHIRVFLDPREKATYENRLSTYSAVYSKITGKNVKFEFPTV